MRSSGIHVTHYTKDTTKFSTLFWESDVRRPSSEDMYTAFIRVKSQRQEQPTNLFIWKHKFIPRRSNSFSPLLSPRWPKRPDAPQSESVVLVTAADHMHLDIHRDPDLLTVRTRVTSSPSLFPPKLRSSQIPIPAFPNRVHRGSEFSADADHHLSFLKILCNRPWLRSPCSPVQRPNFLM